MPAREATGCASQATVRFEDVILYFSRSEWKSLAKWQKELYWEVLTDNYEALLVAGQPVTKAEVVAWLEQCERLDIEGTQESRVRDPAANVSATNDGPSKGCCEERRGQAGSLETLRDMSKEVVTQRGDIGGTPKQTHLSAGPQGNPAKGEPLLHIEHGQSPASPACSQRPAAPPKQYKCRECGKRFRLEGLLRMHQEIAARKTSFACSACGLCFTSSLSLRVHQRTHLPAAVDGEKASPRKNRLSAQQAPENLHQCADCGDRFRGFLDLLWHQKTHEEPRPRPCVQCEASFMHRIDLATHEEGHLEEALKRHDRRRRKCLCKLAFRLHFASLLGRGTQGNQAASQEQDLERPHQDEDVKGEMPYPCTGCGLLFKREENLKVHYRYCSEQKPLLNTSSPVALQGEQREASDKQGVAQPASKGSHGDAGLPRPPSQASSAQHACPECGKHFASKGSLRRHKRKHKAALQRRQSIAHTGGGSGGSGGPAAACATKKLYKCQECGKKLVYKWQMAAHQQGHAEGKSFICHRCGESFRFKSGLQEHRCAAGGAAPGEARLLCCCGKSLSKLQFSNHQAFHAGLRYMCLLCGKMSSFQSSAIAHRRGHVRRGQLLAAARGSDLLSHTIEKVYIPQGPQLQNPEGTGQPSDGFPTGQEAPAEGGKSPRQKCKLKSPRNTLPKPFRCRDCGKAFAYLARLLSHRKEHTGDFPFQCAECGKGFIRRNYLSLHWKIHTKESVTASGSGPRRPPGFPRFHLLSSSPTGADGSWEPK
ncbi:uncharacterized protein LOC114607524 isoform X1 [Podarcis muralis]